VGGLSERLNARYIHRSRGNKSYALNQALETIEDGLVVFFDDDVRVSPDALVAYAEAAKEYGPGHFFGGPVEVDREEDPPEAVADLFPASIRGYDLVNSRMGNTYLGFNWAAYVTDVARAGGFDVRIGPGEDTATDVGDECDLQGRMIEMGCKGVDVPNAKVSHYVPPSNATFRWLMRRRMQSGVRTGIESESSWGYLLTQMAWRTAVSLGVFGKAVVTLDSKKMGFVLCNTFQRVGVLRGRIWK
jgi:GT2 family glycosyltransferase